MLRRIWALFRTRYASRWAALAMALGVIGVLVLVGAGLVVAGAAGLAWTETEKFCTGCHEMRDNVYAEFKGTIHDTNRTGVRASCPDCHVPHEIGPKLVRKVHATWELYGALVGKIDTKQKFEAYRYEMAKRVWGQMKATDSRECHNCHSREAMSKDLQSAKARAGVLREFHDREFFRMVAQRGRLVEDARALTLGLR